jgi:N-acetylglucosamine kinase-like BadF-type ATPase
MRRQPLVELPPAIADPPRSGTARHLLGVDGGATKTLAAVLDLQERVVHLGHAGPSNADAIGFDSAVRALLAATDDALATAGIAGSQLDSAVLAVAGTDTEAIAEHLRAEREERWIVVNDVIGAWATATGAAPGVAAIAGTGSNVFGVGPGGRSWRAGGWGHLLGDEGSGYWLGSRAIKAALADRDGSGPRTALLEAAPAFFAVGDVEHVATLVYGKPLGKSEIAAFAAEAARVADAGDAVARSLFHDGALALAGQIRAVIRETDLGGAFPVGLIGSAFKAGPLLLDPLLASVHEDAPEAQVEVVEMAPAGGSLLLAARAAGRGGELPRAELAGILDAALAASPSR